MVSLVSFVVRFISLFLAPTLLLLAVLAMRQGVPRWIPFLVGLRAANGFLASSLAFLMHPYIEGPGLISFEQYRMFTGFTAPVNRPISIAFAIAVLGMAKYMTRRAE
ncbi:MAG: hypothetical protein DRJ61_08880 [Acidobacteria bacterium]|nr:MAG: hypothetical protein DRJ61_08880 [Acidobacteriota bacterium]